MLRLMAGYLLVSLMVFSGMQTNATATEKEGNGKAQNVKEQKLLRHVVMFTFNDDATDVQILEIVKAFGELPKKIDQIHDYEWGTNNSPEGLNKTHTHCFLVTFTSEADRDAYLPHPAHKEFVSKLKPILKDVTVIDFWASN